MQSLNMNYSNDYLDIPQITYPIKRARADHIYKFLKSFDFKPHSAYT